MTAGHLVAFGDLSLLDNVDFDNFVDSRGKFVIVLALEDADAVYDSRTAMRYFQ